MTIYNRLLTRFPKLKSQLRIAHAKESPEEFIRKSIKNSLIYAFLFTVVFFFVLDKAKMPLFLLAPIFAVLAFLLFHYSFIGIKGKIKKREREIDREVLFAGRYLLVKLYSGRPLLNALIDTSQSYGVGSRYFKEIVDEINTGTTIEDALDNAVKYSSSSKFSKILFQISNALKLGIDVTVPLESVLEDITNEQEVEIKKYGKKLNSVVIFYLLFAVVMPSLGMTMFIIISSFLSIHISLPIFGVIVFFLACIQIVFIALFKSMRPTVNV